VELIGKHANVVLLDERERVIDALRRVTPDMSRERHILPHLPYTPPPKNQKVDPRAVQPEGLAQAFAQAPGNMKAERVLSAYLAGTSPQTACEMLSRLAQDPPIPGRTADIKQFADLAEVVRETAQSILEGHIRPTMLVDPIDERPLGFFLLTPKTRPEAHRHSFPNANRLLDEFYARLSLDEARQALRKELIKITSSALQKLRRKWALQKEELDKARADLECRKKGEILMAFSHSVPQGVSQVSLKDYTTPDNRPIDIDLDPDLSPAANARDYFARYSKAKKTIRNLRDHFAETDREIAYLEQVLACLAQSSSIGELEEIAEELRQEGYMDGNRSRKSAHRVGTGRQPGALPARYLSSDGLEILVGKNNLQNDQLTMSLASPSDLWFHAKEVPGSHVVLRVKPGQEVPDRSLLEAAALAAYHSKARASSKVDVDYVSRKHVWKPKGSRPGMVLYRNHRTITVSPDPKSLPEEINQP